MERNKIKWLPFNSVINTEQMLKQESQNSLIFTMPELSEEQINTLEEKIIFSYYSKKNIIIEYFQNNHIYKIKSQIKKIDSINHLIILNDNTNLFFNQIINLQ